MTPNQITAAPGPARASDRQIYKLPAGGANYDHLDHNLQPVAAPGDVAGLTIEQAAVALGLPQSTLQFWISRRGCPTVRRGGRGRGNATLIDPAAVRHWMAGRDQPATTTPTSEHGMALMYAERLPDLLAQAMYNAWRETDGPAKRQLAASLACAWYQAASAELDRLRERHPDIPHVTSLPEAINKLKSIV